MNLSPRATRVEGRPLVVLAVTMALILAGCAATEEEEEEEEEEVEEVDSTGELVAPHPMRRIASSPRENVPSALDDPTDPRLPEPLIDPDDLHPGGPPPDGIPSIDEPTFFDAADVDFLADNEPVLALEIDGDARAYPIQVMIWHEIVNDTVGGIPVAVTYCPLCNTAIALDRRVGDRVLEFGVSGMLFQSALVMYDRQTESLWSHFTGQGVAGVLAGSELATFPVATVAWTDWLAAYPDGVVLSRETGHDRNYGSNPYPGYDSMSSPPFLFTGEVDGRFAAKTRVVGLGLDSAPTAIQLEPLLDLGVIHFDLNGRSVVAFGRRGTASALFAYEVADGRDVGATGVFDTTHDRQRLTFVRDGDAFVDDQTGSQWNIFGSAVSGPLTGAQLEPIEHVDTFWFAWGAFAPDTIVLP